MVVRQAQAWPIAFRSQTCINVAADRLFTGAPPPPTVQAFLAHSGDGPSPSSSEFACGEIRGRFRPAFSRPSLAGEASRSVWEAGLRY